MRPLNPVARIVPRVSASARSTQPVRVLGLRTLSTLRPYSKVPRTNTIAMTVDTKRYASRRPNVTKENPVSCAAVGCV